MDNTFELGPTRFTVNELSFGQLRKLAGLYNAVAVRGSHDDESIGDIYQIIALALGKDVTEIEALPGKFYQLENALKTIAHVAGLEATEPGKAPAVEQTGTPSTAG